MASSPESAPSQKGSNSTAPSPPSNTPNSNSTSSPPPSPPSSSSPPPSPPTGKSPPPSSPPPTGKSPPPSSPPPGSKSPPPSSSNRSPPPASPPPSSPPKAPPPSSSSPSSPPPSSPPPSSPPPSLPPPAKEKSSPPPASPPPSSGSSPPSSSPPVKATSPPPSSSSPSPPRSPPAAAKSTPPPPSTPSSTPTPPGVFSPPPPVSEGALVSPPGAPNLTPSPPRSSPSSSSSSSSTPSSSSTSRSSDSSGSSSNRAGIITGAAIGGAVVLAVVVVCLLCLLRKKRKPAYYIDPASKPHSTGGPGGHDDQKWNSPDHVVKLAPPAGLTVPPHAGWYPIPSTPPNNNSPGLSDPHQYPGPISPNMNLGKSQFSYDELATATGGFSQGNLLGQGGFGYVHKGVLPNGQEVAVKSLKAGSGQGEREFQAEVEIISRVHHRHLVSLVGYSMTNDQRMLVYEFVPNRTLEFHLHGKGRPVMDWGARLRIAVGSAKGLAYLHEDCHPRIIHRDIKAANILLDSNFEAMVADFGLAKLSSDNITHVSTRVMGTFGYMAPEYASTGKLTEKSDVFSFGVMLLELITGRRPIDPTNNFMEDSLVDWARPLMTKAAEDGNYEKLVDPRLEGNFVPQELARMVSAASSSIRHSARMRPRMSQIVRTLEGDLSSLDDETSRPGHSSAFGVTQGYDTITYNADMMKFKKMVMNSEEFPSSEFGGSTSKYDQFSSNRNRDTNHHNESWRKL